MEHISDIPKPNLDTVVIRHQELAYLTKLLSEQHAVLISGVAGVGKTTLALVYLEKEKEKYKRRYWVRWHEYKEGPSEVRDLFNECNKIEEKGIIVIDDVDGSSVNYVGSIAQSLNRNWDLIVVSRFVGDNRLLPVITISGMSQAEIHELIKKKIPEFHESAFNELSSEGLLQYFGGSPLAISLLMHLYKETGSITTSDVFRAIAENTQLNFDIANKPISIYLDTNNPKYIQSTYANVLNYLSESGLVVEQEFPSEKGSWFKKLFPRTVEYVSSEKFQEKIEEANYGAKLHAITRQQSEIDKNQAEAVSSILGSINDVPNAAIKIGSLLIVKTTSSGIPNVAVKSLSVKEMVELEKKPSLLKSPIELLEYLDGSE